MNPSLNRLFAHMSEIFSLRNMIVAALVCGTFVFIFTQFLGDMGAVLSDEFMNRFGLAGLYVGALLIDCIPTPGGPIPILTLSIQGGASILSVFLVSFMGSLTAALIGYGLGLKMGLPLKLQAWMETRYPGKIEVIREKGTWGVVILAALPLPLAFATWTGGTFRVSWKGIVLASFVRIPKMLIYLSTITGTLHLIEPAATRTMSNDFLSAHSLIEASSKIPRTGASTPESSALHVNVTGFPIQG